MYIKYYKYNIIILIYNLCMSCTRMLYECSLLCISLGTGECGEMELNS